MSKQTAAQKKAAALKKAATAQKAPATSTQTDPNATGTTTQPDAKTTSSTVLVTSATPSLFDQAVAFSMGEITDESQTQNSIDLWDVLGCDAMPPKLAVAVFDCAIQQDPKVCERLLGKIGITANTAQDGSFDTKALADEIAERTEDELVLDFLAWRLRRYAFTGNASTKMLEWSQHILSLQAFVLCDLDAG